MKISLTKKNPTAPLKKKLLARAIYTYFINMYIIIEINGKTFEQNVYCQPETYIFVFQH